MGESKQIAWSGIQVVSVKGATFVFSILMARIIAPEAYGLIAMVTVFIAFFQLFVDSGLGNALIQKKDKSDIDYYTTFTSNITIAFVLYIIMFFAATWIAKFYNQPQLVSIVRWLSLSLIIQSFYLVQKCKLTIEINFKTQAIAGVLSTLLSGIIGLISASLGFGVWALIIQNLTGQLILALSFIILTKWHPRIRFSKSSFHKLFSFGSKDLLGNIFTSFFMNINNLVIGKFYSPVSLAFYNRGFNLGFMPASILYESLSRISYPVQCKYQDSRSELLNSYYKYIGLSSFLTFPVMAWLIVFADPIIRILLNDKWVGAIPFTQILAISFITFPVNACISQVINAIGKPLITLKISILKRCITFLGLLISVFISVEAIAWSMVITNTIEIFISILVSAKYLKISILSQIRPIIKPALATIATSLLCCLIFKISNNLFIELIIGSSIGIISYVSLSYILRMKESSIFDMVWLKAKDAMNNHHLH